MMSYIEFKNVSKIYQMGEVEIKALDDISFEIDKGEFVCVLGASGAGKTTVLNILGGMDSATKGSIIVDGQDISQFDEKQLCDYRRYDIGFVFQFYNLVQNLTTKENVELVTQIAKDPIDAKYALQLVGLQNRSNNFPSQLSGGEQQRVAIARAVGKNPKLLLCDEPTGALDYVTGKQVLKVLQDMCFKNGITVVMITHNSALAAMAQKVIRVKSGKIVSCLTNDNPMDIEDIEY
ncbi:MAG: ABC transporter ATP-binding protein [Erysipelotrichaceae bacterium]